MKDPRQTSCPAYPHLSVYHPDQHNQPSLPTVHQREGRMGQPNPTPCSSPWVLDKLQFLLEPPSAALPYHLILEATRKLSGEERRQLLQELAQEEQSTATSEASPEANPEVTSNSSPVETLRRTTST